MFLTNFFSEKKTFSTPNKKKIRKLIRQLCLTEKKDLSFLNIIFCSDEYLLEINKKHLNHDYFTDVITFDFSGDKKNIEGDVYISIDRVLDNAKKYNEKKERELIRTIIHGVLQKTTDSLNELIKHTNWIVKERQGQQKHLEGIIKEINELLHIINEGPDCPT